MKLALSALLAAAWPAAAAAAAAAQDRTPTAEDLLAAHQAQIRLVVEVNCRRNVADGEIVVCGRSLDTERQALPLPSAPEPGARVRRVAGEAPTGMDALGAEYCLRMCNVGVRIDLETVRAIRRGIDRLLHPD